MHLAWLAGAVLLCGSLVYLLARPVGTAQWLPAGWGTQAAVAPPLNVLWHTLPAACHAFAFTLWTCCLLPPRLPALASACVAWAFGCGVLEAMQNPAWRPEALQIWVEQPTQGFTTLAAATARYLRAGTFDPWDLVATVAGAAGAGALAWWALAPADRARAGADRASAPQVAEA